MCFCILKGHSIDFTYQSELACHGLYYSAMWKQLFMSSEALDEAPKSQKNINQMMSQG